MNTVTDQSVAVHRDCIDGHVKNIQMAVSEKLFCF